ncbi:MAG: aspartate-semialdehyde dehydrogenase [Clostridia bacterium]|nr:aspartate-semialdehyde dehydrogenase [Clostridia bacterium]MBQ8792183.1 aspartate-semialdehyde dehydrogenase [Clostridia bacterium]
MKYNIAIVGATGVVGQTTLKVLEERGLSDNNLFLFASENSEGKKVVCGGKKLRVKKLCEENLFKDKFHFALFCTGDEVSQEYVKALALRGCRVIDYSALYRKDFPLIVPEINMDKAIGNILCNPNCSTIAGVMALYNIHKQFGLARIVYSTYQAVSGAGQEALQEMNETRAEKLKKLDYPIKNNIIPYIGNINAGGYCREEEKMIFESKKILNDFDIKISSTTVRVPVDIGHSLSIAFETKEKASVDELRQAIDESEGVKYITSPMPMFSRGQDYVLVGRLRANEFNERSFSLFVSSDNLRKGAAQNGVQILEKLIENKNDSL